MPTFLSGTEELACHLVGNGPGRKSRTWTTTDCFRRRVSSRAMDDSRSNGEWAGAEAAPGGRSEALRSGILLHLETAKPEAQLGYHEVTIHC